jgi:hypothetical protein
VVRGMSISDQNKNGNRVASILPRSRDIVDGSASLDGLRSGNRNDSTSLDGMSSDIFDLLAGEELQFEEWLGHMRSSRTFPDQYRGLITMYCILDQFSEVLVCTVKQSLSFRTCPNFQTLRAVPKLAIRVVELLYHIKFILDAISSFPRRHKKTIFDFDWVCNSLTEGADVF